MIRPRPLGDLLVLAAPPMVWAAHFATLYASDSFLCVLGRTLPVAATVLAALALAALAALYFKRGSGSFQSAVGLTLCVLAAFAISWTTIPLFFLGLCRL